MNTITDIVKRAAAAFILLSFSLSKKSYKFQLPKAIAEKIAALIAAAEKTSPDGKIVAMDIAVPAFGPHQKTYNDLILKRLGQFRNNEVYRLLEIDAARAIPTQQFPVEFPRLEALRDEINSDIELVADEHFDAWVDAGQRSALRVYGDVFPEIDVWLMSKTPSKAEFVAANKITIGTPRTINTDSLANVNLPADLLAKFEAESVAKAEASLEAARQKAVEGLRKQLDLVTTQLDTGERLSDSLIINTKQTVATLRGFIEAYDNDPRLLSIADSIEAKITSTRSVDVWRNNLGARLEGKAAAEVASKQLKALEQRPLPSVSIASASSELATTGGLLSELL